MKGVSKGKEEDLGTVELRVERCDQEWGFVMTVLEAEALPQVSDTFSSDMVSHMPPAGLDVISFQFEYRVAI